MKYINKLILTCLSSLAIFTSPTNLNAAAVDHIAQYGVTWTFQEKHESGQFANGDYWVVGPVKIIKIDPSSSELMGTTTKDGFTLGGSKPTARTMNGSMLNPVPLPSSMQAYDSNMYVGAGIYPQSASYDAHLNVALGVNAAHPLELPPDSSLVSSISYEYGGRTQMKAAAVLTVLGRIPPDNGATSFRPPYSGTSKPLYSTKNLRKNLLLNLPLPSVTPNSQAFNVLLKLFERPWLDHFSHAIDGTQYSSPADNMPQYGREYMTAIGDACLLLLLNENDFKTKYGQNKDVLLIRLVQVGIDLYHITENGGTFPCNGGLNHGRKWPIIFAGLMLDQERMRTIGSRSHEMPFWGFQEDAQTQYIDQSHVDLTQSSAWQPDRRVECIPFDKSDIGTPEWNIGGFAPNLRGPKMLNKSFWANYRELNSGSYPGVVLSALLLGQKKAWNHDALFDYTDRWIAWNAPTQTWDVDKKMLVNPPNNLTAKFISKFQQSMWETYRLKVDTIAKTIPSK